MIKGIVVRSFAVLIVVLLLAAGVLAWAIYRTTPKWSGDLVPEKPPSNVETKAETHVKFLTWNIQMLPGFFGRLHASLDKMQYERAPWIVDYLKRCDYDIVCFEEAFDPIAVRILVDGLKQVYPYVIFPRYGGHIWQQSNGVLFVSKVPVKYVANVVFRKVNGINAMASKGCTLIEGQKDGLTFQVAGTHFPTGKQQFKDSASAQVGEELLKPHQRPHIPQIAIGDFNIKKDSPEYETLLKDTEMVEFPINDPRPYSSDFQNSWKKQRRKDIGKVALIDHVLLNALGTGSTVVEQKIQRATHEFNGTTIDLSDHYGVIADVLIKN